MNRNHHPRSRAFTLLEMLTVITVILILAAILLNVAGYVNDKASRSRAKGEIEQFATALESYKSDKGEYPISTSAGALYQALTGDGNNFLSGTSGSVGESPASSKALPNLGAQGKNYLPSIKSNQIKSGWVFIDPWGNPYVYLLPGTHNTGTYDIYSTAGGKAGTGTPPDNPSWIKNW